MVWQAWRNKLINDKMTQQHVCQYVTEQRYVCDADDAYFEMNDGIEPGDAVTKVLLDSGFLWVGMSRGWFGSDHSCMDCWSRRWKGRLENVVCWVDCQDRGCVELAYHIWNKVLT